MPHKSSSTSSVSSVAKRMRSSRTGRTLERSGYVTLETVVVWIAYLATVVGNGLMEALRLGGTTSAEVSNQVFTWFTPAGYVFSIWSLIYVGLIVWLVAFTRAAPLRPKGFSHTALLFVVSCVLNLTWLVSWHYVQIELSFVLIVAMWIVLALLYRDVRKGAQTRWEVAPISLYAAWITVATIACMCVLFTRLLNGGIPVLNELTTLLLSAGVLVLGFIMYRRFDDLVFPLVFLWAIIGIGVHVSSVSWMIGALLYAMSVIGAVVIFAPFEWIRSLMKR